MVRHDSRWNGSRWLCSICREYSGLAEKQRLYIAQFDLTHRGIISEKRRNCEEPKRLLLEGPEVRLWEMTTIARLKGKHGNKIASHMRLN